MKILKGVIISNGAIISNGVMKIMAMKEMQLLLDKGKGFVSFFILNRIIHLKFLYCFNH